MTDSVAGARAGILQLSSYSGGVWGGAPSPSKVWESGSKAPRKVRKFDFQVFVDFDAF